MPPAEVDHSGSTGRGRSASHLRAADCILHDLVRLRGVARGLAPNQHPFTMDRRARLAQPDFALNGWTRAILALGQSPRLAWSTSTSRLRRQRRRLPRRVK